jgi:methylthioribose-1-phosphate isomerase
MAANPPARPPAARPQVWNPSFDVAPAPLIEGIITERGLVAKVDGAFQVG